MQVQVRDEGERLIAEQAVLNYRALQEVMRSAPHGQGLAVTERAVREKGQEQMNELLRRLLASHEETQKGGRPTR